MISNHKPYGIYERIFKRPLDIICALLIIVFFWWLLLAVAAAVRVKLGKPVLFKQERPGKDGKIFNLYKFRTMTDKRDEDGNLLADEMRLTKFGKILRATSFDELPEIFKLYLRRKQGESVSREATALTVNQVYWYGIFSELGY